MASRLLVATASHNRSVFTLAGTPRSGSKAAVLALFDRAIAASIFARTRAHIPASVPSTSCRSCRSSVATMAQCVGLPSESGPRWPSALACRLPLREPPPPGDGNASRTSSAEDSKGWPRMADQSGRPISGRHTPPDGRSVGDRRRRPLIAYNINRSEPLTWRAKRIAPCRERSGGLAGVKALGLKLDERGYRAGLDEPDRLRTDVNAGRLRCGGSREATIRRRVLESEIIGLVPLAALAAEPPMTELPTSCRIGSWRRRRRSASFLDVQQVLQLAHELADVAEVAIHRGEPHVGDLVEPLQLLHHERADFGRRDLLLRPLLQRGLDAIGDRLRARRR